MLANDSIVPSRDAQKPRTIAVVSGKGGSGKTMIATQMGVELARSLSRLRGDGPAVLTDAVLMDADVGTAGMSYYLGLKQVRNIKAGFSTIVGQDNLEQTDVFAARLERLLQPLHIGGGILTFLPIGDLRWINREYHRRGSALGPEVAPSIAPLLQLVVEQLRAFAQFLIVDCRGGVDDESIAVCAAADDIILIVESDTTSFQASRNLVDVLSDERLAHKLQGFIINKVFTDPTAVIRSGTSDFGTQFLAAVPFDFDATRAFLVGDLPSPSSMLATHVQEALSRAYPEVVLRPSGRIWEPRDYETANVFAPASSRVGILFALLLSTAGLGFAVRGLTEPMSRSLFVVAVTVLTVLGAAAALSSALRSTIARSVEFYLAIIRSVVRLSPRTTRRGPRAQDR